MSIEAELYGKYLDKYKDYLMSDASASIREYSITTGLSFDFIRTMNDALISFEEPIFIDELPNLLNKG